MTGVLIKGDAVIDEADSLDLTAVSAYHSILLGDAHDTLDSGKQFYCLARYGVGLADKIDLGQGSHRAAHYVYLGRDIAVLLYMLKQVIYFGAFRIDVGIEDDNHGMISPLLF